MVHIVDDWDKQVLFVELERGPERVTKFALVQVVGVGRTHLATVVRLVVRGASNWNVRGSTNFRIVLVFGANILVSSNLKAQVLEAGRAQVFQVVLISHIHV